jgi:GNAT superfamily N-acetyltransferase
MTNVTLIDKSDRKELYPLFINHMRDTVIMNCVLEGYHGTAYADSTTDPKTARLDSGTFTVLGGDPDSQLVDELLDVKSIYYTTPENSAWENRIIMHYGKRTKFLEFTEFISDTIDQRKVSEMSEKLIKGFNITRLNTELAKSIASHMQSDYFLENFASVQDFMERGIGYCAICNGRIVSAATSMARCQRAIDIEIATLPEFRGRGLSTVVGAKLILECLARNIEPKWIAANELSANLALKFGYTKGDTYKTIAIQHPE